MADQQLRHPQSVLHVTKSNECQSEGGQLGPFITMARPLDKFWNIQNEITLINAYKNITGINNVLKWMHEKYPEIRGVLTGGLLRSKIVSLIRQGLRKLESIAEKDKGGP